MSSPIATTPVKRPNAAVDEATPKKVKRTMGMAFSNVGREYAAPKPTSNTNTFDLGYTIVKGTGNVEMNESADSIDHVMASAKMMTKFGTPGASHLNRRPTRGATALRLNKQGAQARYTISKNNLAAQGVTYVDMHKSLELLVEDLRGRHVYAEIKNAAVLPSGPFINVNFTIFPYFEHQDQPATYPLVEIDGDTAFLRFDLADKHQYNLGDFGWTYCASYATRYATPETDRQGEIKQRFGTRHEKVWTLHSDKAVAQFQTGAKEKGTECLEKGMGSLKTAFSRAYPSASVRWTVYRCETASLPVSFFEYVEVSESDDE